MHEAPIALFSMNARVENSNWTLYHPTTKKVVAISAILAHIPVSIYQHMALAAWHSTCSSFHVRPFPCTKDVFLLHLAQGRGASPHNSSVRAQLNSLFWEKSAGMYFSRVHPALAPAPGSACQRAVWGWATGPWQRLPGSLESRQPGGATHTV